MAKKSGNPSAFDKWSNHLEAFKKANPKLSLKEAMQKAKKTYKK